ncbi:MAG: hypothetical protein K0R38_125 [Polyangiaceae bacterium]|jgi:hypothetical protein|nr:hypothetical protein [Polyangiaceae bacterium]
MIRRSAYSTLTVLVSVGACSVLNSPEALKPVDEGSGAVSGTAGAQSTGGTSMSSGGTAFGGDSGVPLGGGAGAGDCGSECVEGGAPPLGKSCTDSPADCGSTAPICDALSGECRACATSEECAAEVGKPHCVMSGAAQGRCAECLADDDCSGRTPVCGPGGLCRACSEHDECASGACNPNGACESPTNVVYALAQTGVSSATCGTQDEPCRNLSDATTKLTAARRTLVMVKTPKAFDSGGATLPALKGLRVIGNGVRVQPYDSGAFIVPAGAEVGFDNIVISGATGEDTAAIRCTGGSLAITKSTLEDNRTALDATDCDVIITQSSFNRNGLSETFAAAVALSCTAECTKTTNILRNRFDGNGVALRAWDQAEVTIENNLFVRNGAPGYTRVIDINAVKTRFAYNTLVENFNGCTYVGIVACNSGCANIANISYNNFPGEDCQDQVWYGGTLSYSLTEVAYPGATNQVGDPKFVDAANGDYTPGPNSPAVDGGNPNDAPPLDLLGQKRPNGDAPDIGAVEAP